jgi:alkanesulfonate monooxygenase SsuD/methylene tetrahydromethanopterin reductase-like flavin-dependent oxidoreductase (luciferase family)
MEFGAHLPLMSLGGDRPTLGSLTAYVHGARDDPARGRGIDAGDHDRAPGPPPQEARARLLIGPVETCVERLEALAGAGVERILMWPIGDDLEQLDVFSSQVANEVR